MAFDRKFVTATSMILGAAIVGEHVSEHLVQAPQPATPWLLSQIVSTGSLTVTGAGFNTTTFAPLLLPIDKPAEKLVARSS